MDSVPQGNIGTDELRTIVASSMDGFLMIDMAGNIREANESYAQLSGYSREELLTMRVSSLDAYDGQLDVEQRNREIMAQGSLRFETRTLHKDGMAIDVEVSATYSPLNGGSIFSFIRDVSQRKRTQELMAARLRLLEYSLDHTLDELLCRTLDEAEELTGSCIGFYHTIESDQQSLTLRAWSTRTVSMFCKAEGTGSHYPVSQAGVWIDCLRERRPVIHNDYASLPHRRGLPAGHAPVVRELVVPIFRGDRIVAVLGIGNKPADYDQLDLELVSRLADLAWDLARHKQAEEAIRRSEERYRNLVESSRDWIWEVDANGVYTHVSPQVEQIFGLRPEEVLGKTPFDLMPVDEADRMRGIFTEICRRREPFHRLENINLRADGSPIVLETSGVPFFDERGELLGYRGMDQDITERKRGEERLCSVKNQLEAMINALPDLMFRVDREGVFHDFHSTGANELYLPPEMFLGKRIGEVMPEEAAKVIMAALGEAATKGVHRGGVYSLPISQRVKWYELSIAAMGDPRNPETHFVVLARDVTERKCSEAYRAMGQDILDVLNGELGINDAMARIIEAIRTATGVDAVGIRLQNGDDFPYYWQNGFSAEFLLREHSLLLRDRDGGVCRDEQGNVCLECTCGLVLCGKTDPDNPLFTAGGSAWTNDSFPLLKLAPEADLRRNPRNECVHQGYASVALVPIRAKGRIVGLLQLNGKRKGCFSLQEVKLLEGFAENIGEAMLRKQAEEELHKLSQAVEQSPVALVITDLKGDMEYVNPAFSRLTGYEAEEVLGRNPRLLKTGLTTEAEYRNLWQTITGGGIWSGELCNRKKNGDTYWERACIAPITDNSGDIKHFVAIKEDITPQKQSEQEKMRLEAQLLQAQKLESVGRLAGGVAHDFNNILMVIQTYAHLCLMESDPGQQIYTFVKEIQKVTRRAADLTHQLLAFARKQTISPRVIDLNDTVTGMMKMMQRLIGENIQLSWHPAANLWPILLDPCQMDQILANLCVNARDAIKDVGRIVIETRNHVVSEAESTEPPYVTCGEYVLMSVSDNGSGMDEDVLEHIFEPFFTTKGVGEGTGLGLATVYGIVKQNSGFIDVSSKPGRGTTFHIYLPRCARVEAQESGKVAEVRIPRGRETILLVEDDEDILTSFSIMLEQLGYTVLAARNSSEAFDSARERAATIDLLVTDVVMPGMNGRDLADKLQSVYPRLKCLFMSGYTGDIIARHGVLESGVHFIQKPFVLADIAAKVRTVLDGP